MIAENHLQLDTAAWGGLRGVWIETGPLLVHAEVRIVPRKQLGQLRAPFLERVNHEVNLPRRKAKCRWYGLVDQHIVAGNLLHHVQAVQKTRLRRQEVAVEQAVVVHAHGRKRITDKEDGFAIVLFDNEPAVIDRLAG